MNDLIEKLRKKAQSTLNSYTPGSVKTQVDPNDLLALCDLAEKPRIPEPAQMDFLNAVERHHNTILQ